MQLLYYFMNTICDCFVFSVFQKLLPVRGHDPPGGRYMAGDQPIRRFHRYTE